MPSVIERISYDVIDGLIHYDDRPSTLDRAEALAGARLDRRRNYAIIDGEVFEYAAWSRQCTGCEGGGCRECGYRGTARESRWVPLGSCSIKD